MTSFSHGTSRRRVLRGTESAHALAASFIVDAPSAAAGRPAGSVLDPMVEARRAGYDEGYQAAMAELAAAEVAGRAAQLRRVADAIVDACRNLAGARSDAVEVAASEVATLAYDLAEAIVAKELHFGRGSIDALVRALDLVPSGSEMVLRINPADPIEADQLRNLLPDVDVRVVADPAIEMGGCVVVAGPCRIDAQIGAALARARLVISELYPDPSAQVTQ